MEDDLSIIAFASSDYDPPQATVSLAETNLVMPGSPDSLDSVKDEEEDKKPTKKRKSWGQELPTPKTNLPPRKRAKTEDEKEQRRIERVLRNRQAAQSSRERKRQEVEKLEGEKHAIEQQNQLLKERLMAVEHEKFKLAQQVAKMKAEMVAFKRTGVGKECVASVSTPPSPSLSVDLIYQQAIKEEIDDYPFALPTPQNSIEQSSSSSFSSPASSSYSRSPSPSHVELGLGAIATTSDLTQHPAAMLCGLQCQSEAAWPVSIRPTHLNCPQRRRAPHTILSHLLCLTMISVVYSRLLRPLRTIFISLRTGSPLPSTISPQTTPMLFLLIKWLILTPANLCPPTPTASTIPTCFNPTSTTTTTTTTTSFTHPLRTSKPSAASSNPLRFTAPRSIFRFRLLRRLLLCSPALARPLKGATDRAMRIQTSDALRGISGVDAVEREGYAAAVGDEHRAGGYGRTVMGTGQRALTAAIESIEREMRAAKRRSEKYDCITRRKKRRV